MLDKLIKFLREIPSLLLFAFVLYCILGFFATIGSTDDLRTLFRQLPEANKNTMFIYLPMLSLILTIIIRLRTNLFKPFLH